MRLAILGATGPTGQQLVKQALQAGHMVTALVRNPAKLPIKDKHLAIIQGDALVYEDVEKVVKDQDAVLSALGVKPPSNEKLVGPATTNIVKAMENHGIKRLIIQSGFFMDESVRKKPLVKVLTKTFMKGIYEDKKVQNSQLEKSELQWTEVRPTMLTNKAKKSYKIDQTPGNMSKISRANVADFMLSQLSDKQFLNKAVIITE